MTRAAADRGTGSYKWFVAGVLGLVHMISVADRYVMVLPTEPVRLSLGLSDTQLGMLQGTGFAILYCALAVPLGAVADATNRRNLIALGLALWSLATAAAAFADSFTMLLATRVLVGMGEACLIPAGMSLLAPYFAPSTLARGTSIFGLGANLGLAFAFLAGGAVLAALQATGGVSLPAASGCCHGRRCSWARGCPRCRRWRCWPLSGSRQGNVPSRAMPARCVPASPICAPTCRAICRSCWSAQ